LRCEPVGKNHLHPWGALRCHRASCTYARVRKVAGQARSGNVRPLGEAGGRHLRLEVSRRETYLKLLTCGPKRASKIEIPMAPSPDFWGTFRAEKKKVKRKRPGKRRNNERKRRVKRVEK